MIKRITDYKYHAGFMGKIYPSNKQKVIIKKSSNVSRFVYNKLVFLGKEIWLFGKPKLKIDFIEKRIEQLKQIQKSTSLLCSMYPWLKGKDIDSNAIVQAKNRYQDAWSMYHKNHHFAPPKYHKKRDVEKYQTCIKYYDMKNDTPTLLLKNATVRFEDKHHIVLPKIGRIRFAGSPKVIDRLFAMTEVRLGTTTIQKDTTGEYYVSFQIASDEPFFEEFEKTGSEIGIDLNITNFLADNEGNIIDNPKYLRKAMKRLAKAKRVLFRRGQRAKEKKRKLADCKNYQKQRKKVARIEKKIKNCRRNFLNETSTALVKKHDLIVAEELRSKNMMKNHALALSIQDAGWRTFLRMTTYKAKGHGKKFITVSPKNTTQTCSNCGHVMKGDKKLTLKVREWWCPKCGAHHNRDVNAAKNILAKVKNNNSKDNSSVRWATHGRKWSRVISRPLPRVGTASGKLTVSRLVAVLHKLHGSVIQAMQFLQAPDFSRE